MLKIKNEIDFKELEKFGYIDLGKNAYMKNTQPEVINSPWVLRVDKHTRKIKYWNFENGRTGATSRFIQDLIQAGLVEKVVEE